MKIVTFIVSSLAASDYDLSLNMAKFITELNFYWFRQLQSTAESNDVLKLESYYSLQLWESLLIAESSNSEVWFRVKDIRENVESILFGLFWQVCAPVTDTSAGLRIVQGVMAEHIANFDIDSHLRDIIAQESKIYEMMYSNSEQVQKTFFRILLFITGRRVQEHSLTVEMGSSKKKKYSLQSNLLSYIAQKPKSDFEMLGYGLSWLLVLKHFEGATFELRQTYTSNLKDLNIIDQFLEFIFSVLKVGARNKEAFDLKSWQIDEYYVEAFDGESSNSIALLFSHLYLKSLEHIPSLVRNWFSSCTNRQLELSVER
jgi:hypothetical protein